MTSNQLQNWVMKAFAAALEQGMQREGIDWYMAYCVYRFNIVQIQYRTQLIAKQHVGAVQD